MNEREKECLRSNIRLICESKDNCIDMVETFLGIAALQAAFLGDRLDTIKMPQEVHYSIALMAMNMMALMSKEGNTGIADMNDLIEMTTKEKLMKLINILIETFGEEAKAYGK